MKKQFRTICTTLVAANSLVATAQNQAKLKKPNVVFLLIDDMGWKDLGVFDAELYETPAIDQLCKEGIKYTSAYTTAPICSPARASALSGIHCNKLKMWNHLHTIPKETKVLPQILKENGYQNWHVGKWHVGNPKEKTMPTDLGFDVNVGGWSSWGSHSYFWPFGADNNGKPMAWNQGVPGLAKKYNKGDQLTDSLTNEAVELIKKRDKDKPFYLNFWYYSVHTKFGAHQHLIDKYTKKIKKLGIKKEKGKYDKFVKKSFHLTPSFPDYAAMVETVDHSVARLIKALKEEGEYENTLFVFFSDNGSLTDYIPCTPLRGGKNSTYEAGVRVPAFVTWPGKFKGGKVYKKPISLLDVLPTILDATDLKAQQPQKAEGFSLLPTLNGKSLPERDFIWYFPDDRARWGQRANIAVRGKDGKKFILFFNKKYQPELYDLNNDLAEEINIIKQYPERAEELKKTAVGFLKKHYPNMPKVNKGYAKVIEEMIK